MVDYRNPLMIQASGGLPASIWLGVGRAVGHPIAEIAILTELGIQILTESSLFLETET